VTGNPEELSVQTRRKQEGEETETSVDGRCGSRFEEARDPHMVDGRQENTVVEDSNTGSRD
jgi:hypothetical protein